MVIHNSIEHINWGTENKKTVLITGGAGFIGKCLCKLLLNERKDYKVLNVDSLTYAVNPNTIKEKLR